MSKENQIEKMAKIINKICFDGDCAECEYYDLKHPDYACPDIKIAKTLVELNYIKASDVAREIFEEIEKILYKFKYPSLTSIATGQIQTITTDGYHIDTEAFAELKNKYTGGWKKRDCSNCKNRNEEGCSFGNMCITSNSPYATPSHWKAKESEDTE